MQVAANPQWYLVKLPEAEFAIQYAGPNPATIFPQDISGILYSKALLTGTRRLHDGNTSTSARGG
jgi:hypothetical protein